MADIQNITSLTLIQKVIWTLKSGFQLDTVFSVPVQKTIYIILACSGSQHWSTATIPCSALFRQQVTLFKSKQYRK